MQVLRTEKLTEESKELKTGEEWEGKEEPLEK